jgi:hypothetical protein
MAKTPTAIEKTTSAVRSLLSSRSENTFRQRGRMDSSGEQRIDIGYSILENSIAKILRFLTKKLRAFVSWWLIS